MLSDPRGHIFSSDPCYFFLLPKQSSFSLFDLSFARLAPDTVGARSKSLRDKYCPSPVLGRKVGRVRHIAIVVEIPTHAWWVPRKEQAQNLEQATFWTSRSALWYFATADGGHFSPIDHLCAWLLTPSELGVGPWGTNFTRDGVFPAKVDALDASLPLSSYELRSSVEDTR